MYSLIFVMLASVTNVQTGQVLEDVFQAQVDSVTQYAEIYNEYRGTVIGEDASGNRYALSDARIVVLQQNADGNIVYPDQ